MPTIAFLLLATLRDTLRKRVALQLEVLALRQQLATMKQNSSRPSLRTADRLFWVLLSRLWPAWRATLVIVRPETVITGTARDSACSGPGSRGGREEGGRRFRARFATLFDG